MNIDLRNPIIISWFDQLPWLDEPFNLDRSRGDDVTDCHRKKSDWTHDVVHRDIKLYGFFTTIQSWDLNGFKHQKIQDLLNPYNFEVLAKDKEITQ